MSQTQYDPVTKQYHDHMSKHSVTSEEDYLAALKLDTKPLAILEIGCGTGIDACSMLAKHNNIKEYVGIDNSEGMLESFRKNCNDERVKLQEADMDTYIPEKNNYDLVIAFFAIHYTNNLPILLKRIYDGLKPGGYLIFRDAHPLVGLFKKKSKRYDVKEMASFPIAGGGDVYVEHPTFTVEEYITAIIDANFKIIKMYERMGSSSKRLGVAGYEIPTTITFTLQKC